MNITFHNKHLKQHALLKLYILLFIGPNLRDEFKSYPF